MAKVGVVLAGCGVFDGAEIHESVITLLALDRAGADIVLAAPHVQQAHVVNHATGAVASGEQRNVAVEAARLGRGQVKDVAQLKATELDALVFPGGFGVAKNLCTYAFEGARMKVNPEVQRVTLEMARARKPLGAMCIAPVMIAKILADAGIVATVTIGTDRQTASDIESCGARHRDCAVDEICVDEQARVVSTPAYMLASSIKEAAAGIEKLVAAVLSMCR